MTIRTTIRTSFLAASAALLTGCVGGLLPEPAPPPSVYRLSMSVATATADADARVVRVDTPSGARTFNTRDVLILTADGTLSQASQAQWADTIPQLVQDAALAKIAADPGLVAILPVSGARAEMRIHLDIRDFSASFDQGELSPPLARTEIYATVSNASTRKFLGSHAASSEVRAGETRVSSIVQAQSRSLEAAMAEVIDWMSALDASS